MERIEDCFVKFFLSQAPEIEPTTVQALIDQGYKTKVSVLAMDLALDLPQIYNIPLAQKSIIRKYLTFLQENSPFTLSLAEDAVKKHQAAKPNKKRKFDALANDSDQEEEYPEYLSTSTNGSVLNSGRSSLVSPKPAKKASLAMASSIKVSPVKVRRLSINFGRNEEDVCMKEVKEEKIELPTTKTRGRPGRAKKETVRTPSQIRFENQLLNQSLGSKPQKAEESEEEIVNEAPVRIATTRKSMAKASVADSPVKQEPAQPAKFMTNAEKAILAKIEAKKLLQETKKRGRSKKA